MDGLSIEVDARNLTADPPVAVVRLPDDTPPDDWFAFPLITAPPTRFYGIPVVLRDGTLYADTHRAFPIPESQIRD
jgi:hypothetical protein